MASKANHSRSSILVIGVDIGKDVFHLVGFDAEGQLVLRQKIKRFALTTTFEKFRAAWLGWRHA